MSRRDDYDDLDFSEDRYKGRPKQRRVTKAQRHKAAKKISYELDDYIDDDDYSFDNDWDDDPIADFKSYNYD